MKNRPMVGKVTKLHGSFVVSASSQLTQGGTMVMAETSESGPCMGRGASDAVAAGELTMASGYSYSGSCPPDTVHMESV